MLCWNSFVGGGIFFSFLFHIFLFRFILRYFFLFFFSVLFGGGLQAFHVTISRNT